MSSLKLYLTILIISVGIQSNAQIISQFTWDADPVSAADIGPDATTVSGSAISDVGGVGGTNGLNAGLPKRDVNMVIPGSPTFDVNGIDISFDYQREESAGTFVRRGASLSINGCADLSVSFRVDNGVGGFNTINSGNVYAIPDDDIFRNYRFYYMPATGEAALLVNGVVVWSNDGPDARNLYWTGAGNLEVGIGMDGTGYNDTFMDNLIIANIFDSPLPIELNFFSAAASPMQDVVNCQWQTASESNNDYFDVQRSADGVNWLSIGQVDGAGNSATLNNYSYNDNGPLSGISYYRLKQTDFDGISTESNGVSVSINRQSNVALKVYPNPSQGSVTVEMENMATEDVKVLNMLGQEISILISFQAKNRCLIDLSTLKPGVYIILVNGMSQYVVKE